MDTQSAAYLEGFQSFTPSADDNPDCIPFYRAWRGMTNAIGKESMDRWHHLMHQSICWALSGGRPESEHYKFIVGQMRLIVNGWTRPEEPRYSYFYECAPSEPTERDAREYFNREYKRAFPDKRANAKHANQLWQEKQAQALAIVKDQYRHNLARHEERKREHDARQNDYRQKWIDQFRSMAEFESFVRSLEES